MNITLFRHYKEGMTHGSVGKSVGTELVSCEYSLVRAPNSSRYFLLVMFTVFNLYYILFACSLILSISSPNIEIFLMDFLFFLLFLPVYMGLYSLCEVINKGKKRADSRSNVLNGREPRIQSPLICSTTSSLS